MNKANRYQIKPLLYIAAAFTMASVLVLGLLSSMVNAAALTSVGSNIQQVIDSGEDLVLSVRMQKSETPVTTLEVDHNLGLPEFSVYANPADPYGSAAAKAQFDGAGVEVTYTETSTEGLWVIDFGPTVTSQIAGMPAVTFYLALDNDTNGADKVWGSMSPPTTENTFTFNLVSGETSTNVAKELVTALPPEEQTPAAQQVVVPGVPNTAIGI